MINSAEYQQSSLWPETVTPEIEQLVQPLLLSLSEDEKETQYSGAALLEKMRQVFGVDFVTGLPCGELRMFIQAASEQNDLLHLPATNEREAVGIAAGAWLAGKNPAIYLQNSGLFEASNDLGSLLIASRIPVVFLASWRGAPGETATQHLATGAATQPLLSSMEVAFSEETTLRQLDNLAKQAQITQMPVCFLQRREAFNQPTTYKTGVETPRSVTSPQIEIDNHPQLSREQVLEILAPIMTQTEAVISSTGLISRSIYEHYDANNQFYNAGAFGLTSSIGLGVSLSKPETSVMVIEGDGSVLTDVGNLNIIGHYQPQKFIHVVLDNQAYGSCSGEPTPGSALIPQLAADCGYKAVYSVSSEAEIKAALTTMMANPSGPQLLHILINTEGRRDFKRPAAMSDIARRFKAHLTQK